PQFQPARKKVSMFRFFYLDNTAKVETKTTCFFLYRHGQRAVRHKVVLQGGWRFFTALFGTTQLQLIRSPE
ncbi:MAG: hypothetical protein OXC27_07765, partial [Caldilineaceae bacterium]|nr:hypothetical protein [Caldilineaceae bacterium]